jgi:hypothetical protein
MSGAVKSLLQDQAADLAGLTVPGLRLQSNTADPPPKGANGYPAREFGEWLKRRHLKGVGVDSEGVRYDYEAERARLTKAQADKTELEARELSGEMVHAEHVIESWGRMLGALRSRLLSIPQKAAPRARGAMSDEEAASLVEVEVLEALEELSSDGLPDRTRARRARAPADAAATAKADGKPVGRRTSAPVAGKRGRARKVAD